MIINFSQLTKTDYYYNYEKSNDFSDTITRQQLQGHLTKKHR